MYQMYAPGPGHHQEKQGNTAQGEKMLGIPMTEEELAEHEKALSAMDNLELINEEKIVYIEET